MKNSLPVAVQVYSVRDNAAADLDATLGAIAEMGYQGVEFAGLYHYTPTEIKALCEKHSLTPISAHVGLADMLADPEGVIGAYVEIGVKYIAVPYLPVERRPESGNFDAVIADIKKIAEIAKSMGIQLLYHNHDFEFVKIDGEYALERLYNRIPADLLQTELDTCWVNVGGEEPSAYIRKYTGRAPVVHLKDFVMRGKKPSGMYELIGIKPEEQTADEEDFSFRPVGYGYQDIPAILKASLEAGAEWVVVEQDRPANGQTPMESIKLSRDYLKGQGW